MATLIDYRRRIRSVKNTRQLTRAMKFVAAARLRRAQERVLAARPYADQILRVLRSAAARIESPYHPLMARRPEERVIAIMVSGDKGMAGAFNANAVRRGMEFLREHTNQKVEVLAVGKKARDAFRKARRNVMGEYLGISSKVKFAQAKEIAAKIQELYTKCEVDAVYAVYNEFKNVMVQRLRVEKVLPIDPEILAGREREQAAGENQVEYIYLQPREALFNRLLPRYVETEVYRVMLESAAAEQAARMTAMDSATNNAAELIEELTLEMNKIRQAVITREIIEVVSGAVSATE